MAKTSRLASLAIAGALAIGGIAYMAGEKSASRTIVPQAVELGPNLIQNPGFEGAYVLRNGGPVAEQWLNFYCDPPYTPNKCLAPRQENQPGLEMGLAEWKPSKVTSRVHSGDYAQQWFGAARVVDGGILQTVDTPAGSDCIFGAWVQTWSANGEQGRVYWNGYTGRWEVSADYYSSDVATEDDRANSVFMLGYAAGENVYAYGPGVNWVSFGYDSGHYDHYVYVSTPFEATSARTTIYIRNTRLWPIGHNDSYVDDVVVRCETVVQPPATATPAPTSTSTPIPNTETPVPTATAPGCPTCPVCPTQAQATNSPNLTPTPTATPTYTQTPANAEFTPTSPPQPTPTMVAGMTPTYEVTPLGGIPFPHFNKEDEGIAFRVTVSGLRKRVAPDTTAAVVGTWPLNIQVVIRCFYQLNAHENGWGSTDRCYTDNQTWSAIEVNGVEYMEEITDDSPLGGY